MKTIKVVEVVNEYGTPLYYKKENGHKMTPEQFRYNSITKGINYDIKYTMFEGKNKMKQYRTFKLVYKWEKYSYNSKAFHHYNEYEKQASNIVQLPFWNSSATDKKTILARCKMELKSKGYYGGNPTQFLEYVNGFGYQFVK